MKNLFKPMMVSVALAAVMVIPGAASALDVNLTKLRPYVEVDVNGKTVRIERVQDQSNEIKGFFAKTSRKCPPFCIQPATPAEGVQTVGESEVFDFLTGQVQQGTGILVDARTPEWYRKGTIPGSVNYPFTIFAEADENDIEFHEVLAALGVTERTEDTSWVNSTVDRIMGVFGSKALADQGKWDFTNAKELMLFCNGPWCGQSPRAIKGLVDMGYPPEKLHYYRGGMTVWSVLGLTIIPGE